MKNEISGSRVFLTGRGFILGGYTSIDTLWRSVQSDDHFLSDPPAVSDCVEALGDDLAESRLLSRHQLLGLAAFSVTMFSLTIFENNSIFASILDFEPFLDVL